MKDRAKAHFWRAVIVYVVFVVVVTSIILLNNQQPASEQSQQKQQAHPWGTDGNFLRVIEVKDSEENIVDPQSSDLEEVALTNGHVYMAVAYLHDLLPINSDKISFYLSYPKMISGYQQEQNWVSALLYYGKLRSVTDSRMLKSYNDAPIMLFPLKEEEYQKYQVSILNYDGELSPIEMSEMDDELFGESLIEGQTPRAVFALFRVVASP